MFGDVANTTWTRSWTGEENQSNGAAERPWSSGKRGAREHKPVIAPVETVPSPKRVEDAPSRRAKSR
jgi:hypothetical protein